MTTIHFIRHGDVEDPENIYYGRLPGFPLNDDGRACIEYTAQKLLDKTIAKVYSSPLLRTRQSAEILAKLLDSSVEIDERLIEVGTRFEGKSRAHLIKFPPVSTDYTETMEQIYSRMSDFLRDKAAKHPDQEIVAVGHGGPIRILEMGVLGLPFTDRGYEQEGTPVCGSDTVVTVEGDGFKVERTDL